MQRRLLFTALLLCFLACAFPVAAQDTFVTVTDVVGGIYHLPLANCPTQGLTYTRSTNAFGCVSGSTAPAGGSNTQVQFNDSGVLGGDAGFTYVKATDTATIGALVLTTALPATSGGTGFASYAVGDLLAASTTTALSKVAAVASGSVLASAGTGTLPAYTATPSLTSLTLAGATGNTLLVDTTTLIVDATNHRVGVGAAPSMTFHVTDNASDIAAAKQSIRLNSTMTLTSNNAFGWTGLNSSQILNQASFNATSASGALVGSNSSVSASGTSGTVTLLIGKQASVSNTGAGVLSNAITFNAIIPTNSGGGTYTAWEGFRANAATAATTEYGFRGLLAANATRWNLFMDGTAQNHLASNLGIGTGKTVPLTILDVADTSTNAVRGIITGQYSASTDGGRLIGRKARGTAASPTIITTGDTLASWIGEGYDGAAYLQMGAILINSIGTIATNRVPTAMVFQTATDAATSVLTTALTLNKDQTATFAAGVTGTTFSGTGIVTALSGTAPVAAGSQAVQLNSTAAFGIYTGSGAPTISAAKGSLYLRTDGSGVADRAYINSSGSTTWVVITTGG